MSSPRHSDQGSQPGVTPSGLVLLDVVWRSSASGAEAENRKTSVDSTEEIQRNDENRNYDTQVGMYIKAIMGLNWIKLQYLNFCTGYNDQTFAY